MKCHCGCGREEFFGRLKVIEIEYALDESLRNTRVGQRYYVLPGCYEPFIQELQAKKLLDGYLERMRNAKWRWYQRLWRARRILRIQYVIHIRNKGIAETKRISTRSTILFVCSPRVSNILWKYWQWADRNNLVSRSRSYQHPFRTLARMWTSITGTIARQCRVCSLSPSRANGEVPQKALSGESAASRLSVVPRLECCKTDGPQK